MTSSGSVGFIIVDLKPQTAVTNDDHDINNGIVVI